jgi:alkanesulfonate monooxygenase SsuD/methylene tetrahydromethanopterin reductase-like flavin-dependent oxidoreductase (luciferase family)
MRYAINTPNYGAFGDTRAMSVLVREAEDAGWDGFFIWDHIGHHWEATTSDPQVELTAMAMATEHIKLGTMVTPLPRRRPWKVARETVTLDRLSGGRLVLGVGM